MKSKSQSKKSRLLAALPPQPSFPDSVDIPRAAQLGEDDPALHVDLRAGVRRVTLPATALEEFLALAGGDWAKTRTFARKWRGLGLCQHNLPASHAVELDEFDQFVRDTRRAAGIVDPEPEYPRCSRSNVEDTAIWQRYAKSFRAAIAIHALIKDAVAIPDDLWSDLLGAPFQPASLAGRRESVGVLTAVLNKWLREANIRPVVIWNDQPQIGLASQQEVPLISALIYRLCIAVTGTEMVTCAGCQRSFTPRRGTKRGSRNYCDDCRATGVPVRDAVRAYRQRKSRKEKKGR